MHEAPEPDYRVDKDTIKKVRLTLKHREYEDYSDDKGYFELIKSFRALKQSRNNIDDKIEQAEARIYDLSLNTASIKCNDLIINFTEIDAQPDKEITAKDVGKIIKGRSGFTRMTITDEQLAL